MRVPVPGIPYAVRAAIFMDEVAIAGVRDCVAFHVDRDVYIFHLTKDLNSSELSPELSKVLMACNHVGLVLRAPSSTRKHWVTVGNQDTHTSDQVAAVKNVIEDVRVNDKVGTESRWCVLPGSIIRVNKKKIPSGTHVAVEIAFPIRPNVLLQNAEIDRQATYACQLISLIGYSYADVVINGVRVKEVGSEASDVRKVARECRHLPGEERFVSEVVKEHAKSLGFGKFDLEHGWLQNPGQSARPATVMIGHGDKGIMLHLHDGWISISGQDLSSGDNAYQLALKIATLLNTK